MPKKTYRRRGKKQRSTRRNRRTRSSRRQVGGANISGFVFINNATGNQAYSTNINGVGFSGTPEEPYTADGYAKIYEVLKNIDTRVPVLTTMLQNSTITGTKEERGKLYVYLDAQ